MKKADLGHFSGWSGEQHLAKRGTLLARSRIKAAFRGWFEQQGFLEAECPMMVPSPGNETHLHAFETSWDHPDGTPRRLFLHTSPEFAMKKLLAAGETKLFDFARVWRNREESALHAPEFTMLEWYRAREDYTALMEDCERLMRLAADITGIDLFRCRGHECDPRASAERLTLQNAFLQHAGIDLLATLNPQSPHLAPDREQLAKGASDAGVKIAADDSWSDIYSRVLVERIEPYLGLGCPTILCEYPVVEAALARPSPRDPRVAERFELYACGVELANAFGELTDAAEQRRRFEVDMALKEKLYGVRYPLDEDLLDALPHMPPTSGIALGFERLLLLATGARTVRDVIWG